MNGSHALAPVYRISTFRYMTFDELARSVNCTQHRVHSLVRRNGWRVHLDRIGRTRVSVPETFLDQAAPLDAVTFELPDPASACRTAAGTGPDAVLSIDADSVGPRPPERSMIARHMNPNLSVSAQRRDPERQGLVALCGIVGFSISLLFAMTLFATVLPGV